MPRLFWSRSCSPCSANSRLGPPLHRASGCAGAATVSVVHRHAAFASLSPGLRTRTRARIVDRRRSSARFGTQGTDAFIIALRCVNFGLRQVHSPVTPATSCDLEARAAMRSRSRTDQTLREQRRGYRKPVFDQRSRTRIRKSLILLKQLYKNQLFYVPVMIGILSSRNDGARTMHGLRSICG